MHKLRVLKLVLGSRQEYDSTVQSCQEAADEIFEVLGHSCPLLTVVVFESRACTSRSSTWSFVTPKQCGRRSQAKFLGEDVAPYVIKDYEPCSDMLELEKLILG